jgi:hypothetical protein
MRSIGVLGAVLAMGLSLGACTRQGGMDVDSGVGRQASAMAQDPTPVPSGTSARRARFAALPDRGELLRYAAQAPVRDGAYTWHRTALSEQHAIDAIASGTLRVTTPDGRVLGFRYDRSIRHDSGDWTWIGHLPGEAGVQAILTFGAGAVYGSVGQPGTRPLRLAMRGGASWLVETDPSLLAGLAGHATNPASPDYRIVSPAAIRRLLASSPAVKRAALAPRSASAAVATSTVDLLIGYTPAFATAQGGTTNAITRLNSMVDTANVGLSNSQVGGQIRLVHVMSVNYTNTNTNDAALGQLTGYDSDTQQETTPNAAFNALRAAREQYGADLVSLVRPFTDPEQGGCGIAWLVGGGKQAVTPDWEFFGYSVVSDGADRNENDGKTYFCEEHTLAHELGHNMGSQHDRETSKGDDGVLDDPDDYGAFSYSFGYKPAAFYTIMAYGDSGQTSYLTFSNPRTTFCGGAPCGVSNSADNAMSLGLVMPSVAGFRMSAVRPGHDDVDGDGKSDLLFHNAGTRQFSYRIMDGTTTERSSLIGGVGAGYTVAATGDFNGDGKADIVWTSSALDLYLWLGNGSGFSSIKVGTYASGWKIVGAGDVDGDGKSDLLFHNAATRQFSYRIMDGATTVRSSVIGGVGAGYTVAATGDFDGDGKADIAWTSSARDIYFWMGDGTGFASTKVGAYPAGWRIAGAGDVDGDGKSDLLFHNASTREFSYRVMDGTTKVRTWSMGGVGAGYTVAAIGDFNNDGKADVVWTSAKLDIYMWLGNGIGFSSTPVGTYPSGWKLIA